jgi:TonB-dependent receptor
MSAILLAACATLAPSVKGADSPAPADMPPAAGTPGGGGIRGIVLDAEFGSPVPLADIRTSEADGGARAGEDGRFALFGLKPGAYTVVVEKEGYSRGVAPQVVVVEGGFSEIAVLLRPELTDMDEVRVEEVEIAEPKSEAGLLDLRETSLSFQDSIGKSMMSQAGASDAAGALKLVVGATVADGKYASVRGLSDRYVGASMNGIRLPSSDPRRRAVHMDVFPAGTIETLTVSKTFTPDLPGDYTGGGIDIRTIGVPDKFFFNASFSREQNADHSGKPGWTTYEGAKVDAFANSRGRMDLPEGAELLGSEGQPFASPLESRHQILASAENPHSEDYQAANRMIRKFNPVMGTKTGRMPPSSSGGFSFGDRIPLGDETAFGYTLAFTWSNKFKQTNSDETKQIWATKTSPDDSEAIQYRNAVGQQEVKWSVLGSAGVQVGENHEVAVTAIRNRVATDQAGEEVEEHDPHGEAADWSQKQSIHYTERQLDALQLRTAHKWPELFGPNVGLEVDGYMAHNKASQTEPDVRFFKNYVVNRGGGEWEYQMLPDGASGSDADATSRVWRETLEDNAQYGLDVKIPFKMKTFDLNAHLDRGPAREGWSDGDGALKFGLSRDFTRRDYGQHSFMYTFLPQLDPNKPEGEPQRNDYPGRGGYANWQAAHQAWMASPTYQDYLRMQEVANGDRERNSVVGRSPDGKWTDSFSESLGLGSSQDSFLWDLVAKSRDIDYTGDQSLSGGYLMLELPVMKQLTLMFGSRAEVTDMSIDPTSDVQDVMPDKAFVVPLKQDLPDGGYYYYLGGVPQEEATAQIKDSRWLRAMGLTYEAVPGLKLRLNYGETIARPTFLELAPVITYDYISGDTLIGNKDLTLSEIENYDLRLEWFFGDGEVVAFSVFRKDILNPIELESFSYLSTDYLMAVNYPEGEVNGMEIEIRKKLDFLPGFFRFFTIGANQTAMESEVTIPEAMQDALAFHNLGAKTRDMHGQPEHITNFNLTWDHPRWGTSFGLFYNIRGDMLKSGAAIGAEGATADIYTKSLSSVNFSVSQKIGPRLKVSFQAKNLLDPKVEDVYREPDGTETHRKSYHEGKAYSIGMSATF